MRHIKTLLWGVLYSTLVVFELVLRIVDYRGVATLTGMAGYFTGMGGYFAPEYAVTR